MSLENTVKYAIILLINSSNFFENMALVKMKYPIYVAILRANDIIQLLSFLFVKKLKIIIILKFNFYIAIFRDNDII